MDHVRELVVAHLPGYPVRAVSRLGEGIDNVAYEVNRELIVRFTKDPEAVRQVSREVGLLAAVAGICPLPSRSRRSWCPRRAAWRTARPLLEVPRRRRFALGLPIGAALGRVLTALHTTPVVGLAGLVSVDDVPLAEPVHAVDWLRIADLVSRYSDLPLGTVDASVIACAERLGVDEIATVDS